MTLNWSLAQFDFIHKIKIRHEDFYYIFCSTLILLVSSYKRPEMDGESNKLLNRANAVSFLKRVLEATAIVQGGGRGSLRSKSQAIMPFPFVPSLVPRLHPAFQRCTRKTGEPGRQSHVVIRHKF